MKLLIPIALSFAISSCPGREELPRNIVGAAWAGQAETANFDQTIGRELHFASGSAALSNQERRAFDDFLLNTDKRIRDLKVILWFPPDASEEQLNLVQARVDHLIELLRAHKIPYEILSLESPYYEDSQGSLLAVLEP